jgi:hypothetical protein
VIARSLPLTRNGWGAVSKVVRERSRTSAVARISPSSARAVSRAARLIVSPMTAYARLLLAPTSPAKAGPRLTPARSASGDRASRIVRSARSMRSSSAPVLEGAPAVR